jgi:nucleoside-diphosphate-sugar epimerase
LLTEIALNGRSSIYNVASGNNHSNGEILDSINEVLQARILVSETARDIRFKPIEIARIRDEFGFQPRPILPFVAELAKGFRVGD